MDGRGVSRSKKTWWVYIVRCRDTSLYTGISTDVAKRIETHNKGKGAKYTKKRLPVVLVCMREVGDLSQAMQVEYRVKHNYKAAKVQVLMTCDIPCSKGAPTKI